MWELRGSGRKVLAGVIGGVRSLRVSAGCRELIAAGLRDLWLWDLQLKDPGSAPKVFQIGATIEALALDGGRALVAAGTKVHACELAGTSCTDYSGHTQAIAALSLSEQSGWMITGAADGTARLWELRTKQLSRTLERAAARVAQVGFSHSGRQVFIASVDNTFRTFDVGSGALLRTLRGPANNLISAALSGDDKLVALADSGPLLHLFDLESGVLLRDVGPSAAVVSIGFGAAGSQLLTVEAQGSIAAWNLTPESRAAAEVADWMRAHSAE